MKTRYPAVVKAPSELMKWVIYLEHGEAEPIKRKILNPNALRKEIVTDIEFVDMLRKVHTKIMQPGRYGSLSPCQTRVEPGMMLIPLVLEFSVLRLFESDRKEVIKEKKYHPGSRLKIQKVGSLTIGGKPNGQAAVIIESGEAILLDWSFFTLIS